MKDRPLSRNPWLFLTTLYFTEGLPYVLINTVSKFWGQVLKYQFFV